MPRLRLLLLALFAYRAFDQKPWVVVGWWTTIYRELFNEASCLFHIGDEQLPSYIWEVYTSFFKKPLKRIPTQKKGVYQKKSTSKVFS